MRFFHGFTGTITHSWLTNQSACFDLVIISLQVNALSEWIIGIYLHEFTNNQREISIPHEAAECGIENFEFIVSELVQVNPDNSRAMSVLTLSLFKIIKADKPRGMLVEILIKHWCLCNKKLYIITQVILAFWFVLAYDLLEDGRTIDVIITELLPLLF